MEKQSTRPYIIVVCLMLFTSVALAISVDVNVTNEAGIRVELPDKVGTWTGVEMRFCVERTCRKRFTTDELDNPMNCPSCANELSSMTYAEKLQLPDDTILLKKRYTDLSGETLFASIVLSGKERASIHRPQVCLTGQNREIVASNVLQVPIANRDPLKVMVLDLYQKWEEEGKLFEYASYYAYWFVGKNRETPYHLMRMFWMASDRVFKNVAHRWAYISVSGRREQNSDQYKEIVQEFLAELYPAMSVTTS